MGLRAIVRGAGGSRITRSANVEEQSAVADSPPGQAGALPPGLTAPPEVLALEEALAAAHSAFADVDGKRAALTVGLTTARDGAATATKAADCEREIFDEALAAHQIDGGPAPSRRALTTAEGAQRDAEDRVRALERRRPELDRIWRRARLDVLDAEQQVRHARNAARQVAIDALRPERAAIDVREGALFAAMHADLEAIAALRREADDLRRTG